MGYGNPHGGADYINTYAPPYAQDSAYAMDTTHCGVIINPKQIYWIRKRRVRREMLDSIMVTQSANYLHESRHRHAMKRLRAPSGRFLTKEETEAARSREERRSGL